MTGNPLNIVTLRGSKHPHSANLTQQQRLSSKIENKAVDNLQIPLFDFNLPHQSPFTVRCGQKLIRFVWRHPGFRHSK